MSELIITKYNVSDIESFRTKIYNLCYVIKKSDIHKFIRKEIVQLFLKDKEIVNIKHIGRNKTIRDVYKPTITTSSSYILPLYMKSMLIDFLHMNNVQNIKFNTTVDSRRKKEYLYNFKTPVWPSKMALIEDVHLRLLKNKGVTLELGTGKGKTVIIGNIIYKMGLDKVVIFTCDASLQYQMLNDMMEHLGLTREEILLIGGDATSKEKKYRKKLEELHSQGNFKIKYALTICVGKSAANIIKKYPKFWNNFQFSIFDECHKFCAEETKTVVYAATTPYKMALSATVMKSWNYSLLLHSCGEYMNGNNYIKDDNINGKVDVIKYYGPDEYTEAIRNEKTGNVMVSSMVSQFAKDPYRNKMIMDLIKEKLDNRHNVLVFALTLDMINYLYDMFSELYPEINSGLIVGSIKMKDRRKIYDEAQVIFITYGTGATGLNIPRMTAIVFASSFVENGIQITGRCLRGNYDKETVREYTDIVDANTTLYNQLSKRIQSTWNERGFDLNYKKIHYKDINLI